MMMLKTLTSSPVLLIRPGSTEFDEQGRIKGSLDMPMSDEGHRQVESMAATISDFRPKVIYSGPCESARQTATKLGATGVVKVKVIDALRNVDQGLWHGKLIDELKRNHPKLYKHGLGAPQDICPPGGESYYDASLRIEKAINRLVRKSNGHLIAIVVPDPLARIVQSLLSGQQLSNMWQSQTDSGHWDLIEAVR